MPNPGCIRQSKSEIAGAITVVLIAALAFIALPARAQTFVPIHTFTGGNDGATPMATLTVDRAGNLYGTTKYGGLAGGHCGRGCGTIFKLALKNSHWIFSPLYSFQGGSDGAYPEAPITFGPDGALYGTTNGGGINDHGTVYRLTPPVNPCIAVSCPWLETVLFRFNPTCPSCDASYPAAGVVFDNAGNIYGTTLLGGINYFGTVYQLTRSGGIWTGTIIHAFGILPDGTSPYAGVVFDNVGNLYGTTELGGDPILGNGTVFQLTPSGGGWTETLLHAFNGADGNAIQAGVIFDQAGNLYGAASSGGTNNLGTIFQLTANSDGTWNFNLLYTLGPGQASQVFSNLIFDQAGNLYGTGVNGGSHGAGAVFELLPSGGSWSYTSLYDFANNGDGAHPYAGVVRDANGNLFGASSAGGMGCAPNGCGTIWEIMP